MRSRLNRIRSRSKSPDVEAVGPRAEAAGATQRLSLSALTNEVTVGEIGSRLGASGHGIWRLDVVRGRIDRL